MFCFFQWPHPSDGHRDQSGRGSGAEDSSQICWSRVGQCKNQNHFNLSYCTHLNMLKGRKKLNVFLLNPVMASTTPSVALIPGQNFFLVGCNCHSKN